MHLLTGGERRMKKTYTRITVLICALITFVMLLGCALFTYVKVSDINDTYIDRYSNLRELAASYNANADLDVALLCTYSTWETYYSMTESNVGYYSVFMWKDMASSNVYVIPREDFIWIYYNSEYTGSGEYRARILKPNDDFTYGKEEHLWNVALDAKTDDVFVYDGTVSFHRSGVGDRTVATKGPADLPYTIGELTDDWGEGKELYATYIPTARNNSQAKLNEEAKNTLYEVLEGQNFLRTPNKKGFFTSYTIHLMSYKLDDVFTFDRDIFIFHPFQMVLANYWYIYFLFLAVMVTLNILCIVLMRKLYINRRNYEARTQKLTRSVAHELKTPLAVIKAYTENWEYVDEKDRPEVAAKINTEVDHMAKMVSTLLDLSKMEAGDVKINLEEVELYALTKACYKHIEPIAKERGIDVEFIKDDGDAEYLVNADLAMIKMVISNFLSNAVKYGKKKVEIRFSNYGNNVTFKITNDGKTISAKDQKRIWDLFYKTDDSGSDRMNSTGIGLAVNKSILELHKAKYGVWSGTGNTIFWFEMKRINK